VEVIDALDRESPTYALDLLTLVESILENPEHILMRQVDRLKTEKMIELKAAGVEYDQRIEELDKVEYPKPNAEFIYAAFNAFSMHHPWVGGEAIRPKSVAREMFENLNSVNDYVRDYGLERSEGLLLRYLSDCYKTLVQTVPANARTPEVDDIIVFLGAIVRSTDSSLIEEWEAIQRGEGKPLELPVETESVATKADRVDVTTDERAFTVLVRNALYSLLRSLERGNYESAAEIFEGSPQPPRPNQLQEMVRPYFEEHGNIRLDPPARSPQYTRFVSKDDDFWRIEQIICDPQEAHDWMVACRIDLEASRGAGRPVFVLDRIGT